MNIFMITLNLIRNMKELHYLKNNIKRNPGLRGVSKLALNSFYGKFGQRTNLRKTKLINGGRESLLSIFSQTRAC